jgi:hypothetical protein
MLRVNTSINRSLKTILQSKNSLYPILKSDYSTSYEEWKKIAKSQLKDKPAESLISKTAEVCKTI